MDTVMIEHFWRSPKCECVYLNAFETASQARKGMRDWIDYSNQRRPHSSLDGKTPDEACWGPANTWTTEAAAWKQMPSTHTRPPTCPRIGDHLFLRVVLRDDDAISLTA